MARRRQGGPAWWQLAMPWNHPIIVVGGALLAFAVIYLVINANYRMKARVSNKVNFEIEPSIVPVASTSNQPHNIPAPQAETPP